MLYRKGKIRLPRAESLKKIVFEIMGSEYSTGRKKVLHLIKWKGYPEQSEGTEEPLEHLPRARICEFDKRHPEAAMDDKLKKNVRRR